MALNIYSASVPVFTTMLTNAKVWLDKGAAYADQKKFDVSVLLQARLAPDMFHFTRQIQAATDQAKGGTARLQGIPVPSFEDNEKTIADLHARLDKTIAFVKTADAEKMLALQENEVVFQAGTNERRYKNGEEYLRTYVMPNFFFHITTAYGILRHNGIDVGKADYLRGGRPAS